MRRGSNIPDLLTDPSQMAQHLGDSMWLAVDCRAALDDVRLGRRQYELGHIPGAVHADLETDLSGPAGARGRHPLPARRTFRGVLERWGVSPETRLVAYDSGNGAFACRFWWMARWIGHPFVTVLDGGSTAWTALGQALTDALPERATTSYPDREPLTRSVGADAILASDNLDSDYVLVDARAEARFNGEVEPIDFKAGHIPGAVCRPFEENLDADGRFDRRGDRFADLEGRDVVCYCGSGVTATHNIFAMLLAGLPEPALYPGSWSEWIQDPTRPTVPP